MSQLRCPTCSVGRWCHLCCSSPDIFGVTEASCCWPWANSRSFCFVRKSSASLKGSEPASSRSEHCWGMVCSYLFGGTLQTCVPKRSGLSAAAKGQRRPLPSEQRPISILPCTVFSLMFLSILIKSKSFFLSIRLNGTWRQGLRRSWFPGPSFWAEVFNSEVTAFYDAHSVPWHARCSVSCEV